MKLRLLPLMGIAAVSLLAAVVVGSPPVEPKGVFVTLSTGSYRIRAEIADTEAKRQLGLAGRDSISADSGMLFVFDSSERHGIWMNGMRFPLDVIWLDPSFRVVHLEERVSPETYPRVFYPNERARYVLELNGGTAAKTGIVVGAKLRLRSSRIKQNAPL